MMFCLLDWSGYRDGLGAAITADFTDPYSIGSSRRSRLPFDLVTFSTPRACVHHWSAATDANDGIRLSYGLGWGLYWSPYGKIVFREGHDDGFRNYSVVFDKSRNGMVIMTNSSNGEGIFKDLLETLLHADRVGGFHPVDPAFAAPAVTCPHGSHTRRREARPFAGAYAVRGITEKVVRVGGHLTMRENAETPWDLFPESDLSFFSKTSDDVVTFDLDADGRPIRLVIRTGGQNLPVPRTNGTN